MLNHNINFENRQAVHEKILASNALMFGALAWRGYQLKGRGAILVYGLKASKAAFSESIEVRTDYLTKVEVIQNYPDAIRLFQLLDEYNPNNEIIVSFIQDKNTWIDSYCLALEIPLINCFVLRQEQLLLL
ncbi:MAG: hypothetical protein AB1589_38880 [Cyanobacteriota bacterium]